MTKPITDKKTIKIIKEYLISHEKYRELLFFLLAINTGLMCTEILKLNISDVLDKDYLLLHKKKDETIRFLLNKEIKNIIHIVVANRSQEEPLFISHNKNRLCRSDIFRWFQNIFKEIGLDPEYSVSSFRKTFGYQYYKKTKDLSYLQWVFNQSSIQQAMEFIGISEDMNLRLVPMEL